MKNLVAYIPTLNQRHIDWFEKHEGIDTNLFLISQSEAQGLIPRLERNVVGVPTEIMVMMLRSYFTKIGKIAIFSEAWLGIHPDFSRPEFHSWIAPDEDVSEAFAGKYLIPAGCCVEYESIWARYDMKAVIAQQPALPDVELSTDEDECFKMMALFEISSKSPDWWRRVAAGVIDSVGTPLVALYNTHMPTEYETYIFGDPAINRDAGQAGKSCALHAERAVICECARRGIKLEGAIMYVTTFPCEGCAMEIAAAGVKEVVFYEGYSSLNAAEILRSRRIKIVKLTP